MESVHCVSPILSNVMQFSSVNPNTMMTDVKRRNITRVARVPFFFFQAEDGIRDKLVTGVQTCALPIYPAGLPALPPGWTRDYFFFVDGFTKDMDFYAAHADTVEPLPYHTMIPYPYPESQGYPSGDRYVEYQLNFNTRQLSGRGVSAYRFQFPQNNNP